jgi:modulator of FtsH protease HflK
MPWNEPGNSSNNKDPWTGRPKQTPPDLEAFLRDLAKKIVALFKFKTINKSKTAFTKVFLLTHINTKRSGILFSFLLLAWLLSGFFTVASSEQAIITRFGKYDATLLPGHHWIFRPFESRYIIPEKMTSYSYQTHLLTQDENQVSITAKVHYSVVNAQQYLFANTNPLQSLQEVIANTIHQTLGQFSLDQLLTANLTALQQTLHTHINKLLTLYMTGLSVSEVELQTIQVPETLKPSFEALNQAQIEKEQLEDQAKAYAMQVEPTAKGKAEKLINDAKNYQQEVILNAKAETARFLALLPAYETSPRLIQKRLQLETLQAMMAHSNNILIDDSMHTSINLNVDKKTNQYSEKAKPMEVQSSKKASSEETTPRLDMTNTSKTNNALPSSYNIEGGYE